MEKPAAIFSEEGLKIFIEALTRREACESPDGDFINRLSKLNGRTGDDQEVQKLVKEYENQSQVSERETRMRDITALITDALMDFEVRSSIQIREILETNGYEYGLRSITPLMKGVINRNPDIEKVGTRQYRLRRVDNEES